MFPYLIEHARCASVIPAPDSITWCIIRISAKVNYVSEQAKVIGLEWERNGGHGVGASGQVKLEKVTIDDGREGKDTVLYVSTLSSGVELRVGLVLVRHPLESTTSSRFRGDDLEIVDGSALEGAPLISVIFSIKACQGSLVGRETDNGSLVRMGRVVRVARVSWVVIIGDVSLIVIGIPSKGLPFAEVLSSALLML
jgi:hypothetical protein